MKPESFKFGTAVRVQWLDSAMRRGWSRPSDDAPYIPQHIVSQGFVVEATTDSLTITTSVDDERSVIAPLIVPWGCIKDIKFLPEEYNF